MAQYYPWIVAALSIGLLYLILERNSLKYAEDVKKELSDELKIESAAVPPLQPALLETGDSASVSHAKREIRQTMAARPPDMARQLDLLTNDLAILQIHHRFTLLHIDLYRSQIAFLRALNSVGGQTTRLEAEAFLRAQAELNRALTTITFENWVRFLVSRELVIAGLDSFQLTETGQDFLVWVLRNRLPEKPNETL